MNRSTSRPPARNARRRMVCLSQGPIATRRPSPQTGPVADRLCSAKRLPAAAAAARMPGDGEHLPIPIDTMDLKDHIRSVPDFPVKGILFYDISTLLAHADAWQVAMGRLARVVSRHAPDVLAGIESRGFLVAAPLASSSGSGSP